MKIGRAQIERALVYMEMVGYVGAAGAVAWIVFSTILAV